MPKRKTHINDNTTFAAFREQLAKGSIRLSLAAELGESAYAFTIIGASSSHPASAVVIDLGEDGFRWFPESTTIHMSDDIKAMVGEDA